jgi:hypothetical protein
MLFCVVSPIYSDCRYRFLRIRHVTLCMYLYGLTIYALLFLYMEELCIFLMYFFCPYLCIPLGVVYLCLYPTCFAPRDCVVHHIVMIEALTSEFTRSSLGQWDGRTYLPFGGR